MRWLGFTKSSSGFAVSYISFPPATRGSAAQDPADDVRTLRTALALAERRFEATFDHAPVGIAHVGLDGRFLLVNPRFCEITGYPADMLMRTGFQQITHPDDLHIDEILLARLNAGAFPRYTMEKRYIHSDRSIVWINLTVAMVRDEAGAPELYVAVIEDMSDVRKAHHESAHDPLTGLLNRRGLAAMAEPAIDLAARLAQAVSLVYLDLDGFKALNDRLGHSAGDRCLVDVSRLLVETRISQHDALARIGGDEFVLLFAGLAAPAALGVVERLRQALCGLPWMEGEGISGSFGLLTVCPGPGAALSDLIHRADQAMLRAKRAGGNQVVVADAG